VVERIAAGDGQLLEVADFTRLDRPLKRCMSRIETPVKRKKDIACLGTQGVDAPLRVRQGRRKRLFTHHGFSCLDPSEDAVNVGV
jgi:hypothetical protein